MPSIPPPPPLPITTAINILKHRNSVDLNNNKNSSSNSIIQSFAIWAFPDYAVQCSCYFARTCVNSSPRECCYLKVEPILQTGENELEKNSLTLKSKFGNKLF